MSAAAGSLTGTGTLVGFILRRDRIRLPVWLVAILGLVYASAAAAQGIYSTAAERTAYAETVGDSPAAIVMSGPATAVDTMGGITVFEVSTTAILGVALMAIFLTVRHTRAEEEAGRTELLRAGVLGRDAPLAAALIVVFAASVLVGAGVAVSMLGLGLPTAGSLVYGASIGAVGIVFSAIAALAAQATEHARGAIGLALAVLGAAFVLRGAGDAGSGTLSWLSPIGWSQAVHAYGGDRWWPLLVSMASVAVVVALATALIQRRDVGAGLVAARPGPPAASAWVAGPFGLAARLQWGAVISWAAGTFVGGIAFGSVGREVRDLLDSQPGLADVLTAGGTDIVDAFFGTALLVLALIAAGFTVGSVLRLRSEETSGRAEPLLATGLSRRRWSVGSLAVTLIGTVLVVGMGGLGAGLAHGIASDDMSQLPRLLAASLAYAPAPLVLGGLAVALFGWTPRAGAAAWGVLGVCFVIGWLGGLLDLPGWLVDLSPFSHVPSAPVDQITAAPLLWLGAVAVGLGALGVVGLRDRDITCP